MQIPLQLVCGCKGTAKIRPFPENARTQILTVHKACYTLLYIRVQNNRFGNYRF